MTWWDENPSGVSWVGCFCAPSDDRNVSRLFARFVAVFPWRLCAAGLLGSCRSLGLAKFDALLLNRGRGTALLLDRGRGASRSSFAVLSLICHGGLPLV